MRRSRIPAAEINLRDAEAARKLVAARQAASTPLAGASTGFISDYQRPAFLPQDLPGLVAHFIAAGVGENSATHDVMAWRNHATGQTFLPSGSPDSGRLLKAGWDGKDVVDSSPTFTKGMGLTGAIEAAQQPLGSISAFAVVMLRSLPPSNGNQFRIVSGPSNSGDQANRFLLQINNSAGTIQMRFFNEVAASPVALLGPVVTTGRKLLSYVFNGANTRLRVNGGADTTGNGGSTVSARSFSLLGDQESLSSSLDGYLAELVMYNQTVSLADQTRIETYLNSKWAIF